MQLSPVPSDEPIADEIIRILADRGPCSFKELSEAFGEEPDDLDWVGTLYEDILKEVNRIVELHDERLTDAVALLSGCTLTRRITDVEAAGGYLELGGDLQPFATVIDSSVPLALGGRASVQLGNQPGQATTERLVGPPGWLGDTTAGDLVGLRLAGGLLSVAIRPDAGDPSLAAVDAFARATHGYFDDPDLNDGGPPDAAIVEVIWDALAAAPDTFSGVLPPLSEIAASADLQVTETEVVPGDADLDEYPATSDTLHDAMAMLLVHAGDETLASLKHLRAVTRQLEIGADVTADDLDAAAVVLADFDAFYCYTRESADRDGVLLVGAAVAPVTSGTARAAARYLQARHAWRGDDVATADALLRDALEADPDYGPALVDMARLADIRGDAVDALRMLQRSGVRDDRWLQQLRSYTTGVKTGRNEPCPCGSGRKTKRCCGGGGLSRPLAARAAWLLEKLYASHDQAIEQRLAERLEAAGHLSDWVDAGSNHAVVEDVVMFDLGMLDDFLGRWGAHLPDDERELALTWRTTGRGLYEVHRVQATTVTLVDRRDGTERVAQHGGTPPPRGTTVLGRLLPNGGGGWLLIQCVPVDDEHHPSVTHSLDPDADPLEVAEIWGSGHPLPSTTEGKPSVQCTWEAPLAAERGELLRVALLRHGLTEDEPEEFTETVEIDGMPRLRGTVTIGDGIVRITTSSEPRLDRLVGYVRDAVGELEPTVDRRTPVWRALVDQRLYGVPPSPDDELTPEARAAVDEVTKKFEESWLDKPVPALSNLTPREARDHPTGRHALMDLLDTFDAAPAAGGFNRDRLRSLLDL
jgi:hypothetical protein